MHQTPKIVLVFCFVNLLVVSLLVGCVASSRTGPSNSPQSTASRLHSDVRVLSEEYGGRSANNRGMLNDAGVWIGKRLASMGYSVDMEPVKTAVGPAGFNVVAELKGTTQPREIVIVGAHYDAEVQTPGADDNASGVAGMLELARRFVGQPMDRTIRFVAFTNEENSNSAGGTMGSSIHAKGCSDRREKIVAMLSLEMLGYYSDEPDSQRYPFPTEMAAQLGMELPSVANFIGIVGRLEDRALIEELSSAMISAGTIDVVPAALPRTIIAISRSDHALFWLRGYTAVMVTDTSEYRNPHYHKAGDTIETLDFERMAGTVEALAVGVRVLASPAE